MSSHEEIHLPGPSPWPAILGLGVLVLGAGISLDALLVLGIGVLIALIGTLGWAYDEIRETQGQEEVEEKVQEEGKEQSKEEGEGG